ncbi:MAG: peptidylprolyl isomerase, partial [Melioribacteraceae bacterium]|nr:peptidylprolyl isomerase [Melioribacteraceae bacterium]
ENLLTNNSFGELLLSYSELTDADILLLIEKYKNKLDQNFILLLLTKLNTNCDLKLKYLSKFEPVTNDIVVNWTTALISMHDSLYNSDKYKNLVLKSLASDSPEMVNIVATNLDSEFIQNNLNEIKIILKKYITEYSNNPDFLETTVAIINLAPGLGEDFSNNLFTELSESKLPGVINAIAGITGENIPFQKTNRRFDIFWEFAFNYSAIKFTTNKGEFTIKLYPEIAPVTVGNLLYLSHKGFYNNVSFHRVVPNFVIQTGDTSGTGWRGPGYDIISEFSFLPFEEGYVGMASAGKDTEGSQWFVMHSNFPHLNGRYTNFGKVISGFDTVSIIDQDDFIISAELIKN